MPKMHTRQKRSANIPIHTKGKRRPLIRKSRPKTFNTEEKAKAYAEKEGIKKYTTQKLRFGLSKKIVIIKE